MRLLPKWALLDPPAAIYDLESVTPLQQTARVYGAMNDMIREYNTFADQINKEISEFVGSSETEISNFKKSVEDRIRCKFEDMDVTFAKIKTDLTTHTNDYLARVPALPIVNDSDNEKALRVINGAWKAVELVDKTLTRSGMAADAAEVGALKARVNNLSTLPEGSTTGDAELTDIRIGADGRSYENAGNAVRAQRNQSAADSEAVSANMALHMVNMEASEIVSGSWLVADGSTIEGETASTHYFEVEPNTRYFVSTTSYWQVVGVCFFNGETFISSDLKDTVGQQNYINAIIRTPDNCTRIALAGKAKTDSPAYDKNDLEFYNYVPKCARVEYYPIDNMEYVEITETLEITEGAFWYNGPATATNYRYCKIPVMPGERYIIETNQLYEARGYCLVDCGEKLVARNPAVNSNAEESVCKELTIPDNIGYLVVNNHSRSEAKTDTKIHVYKMQPKIRSEKQTANKWLAIGDSLTAPNTLGENVFTYADYVQKMTGYALTKRATGGTGFVNGGNFMTGTNQFHTRLADAAEFDIITAFGSFNDLYADSNKGIYPDFGSAEDTTPETVCGAVYQFINNIITANPTAKIGIILPTPWRSQNPVTNTYGYPEKYVNAVISVCKRYGVPYLDLFHGSGIPFYSDSFVADHFLDGDGTHPLGEVHRDYIAPKVYNFIKTLM